jgi:hypothetical protein
MDAEERRRLVWQAWQLQKDVVAKGGDPDSIWAEAKTAFEPPNLPQGFVDRPRTRRKSPIGLDYAQFDADAVAANDLFPGPRMERKKYQWLAKTHHITERYARELCTGRKTGPSAFEGSTKHTEKK